MQRYNLGCVGGCPLQGNLLIRSESRMNAVMQTVQSLGSTRVVTLSVVGIILLMAFGILSSRMLSPVMLPLYTNLSADDSAMIVTELGAIGVDFEIAGGGSQILVPGAEKLKVRMALAQKGLPRKGSIVGYEIFDKDSALGTSNFVHNVNFLRALEGELKRTIESLATVKSARVHIVMPKRELFQRGKIEPSASVMLTMNDLTKTAKKEAMSVQHLVASAIPGMKVSRVTVIDSSGKVLARGTSEDDGALGGGTAEEYKDSYESRLKSTIENILEPTVGIGGVEAQVSVEMAFDRVTTSSETFDPDGQVARSIQTSESIEEAQDGSGGEVSVANNLPEASADSGGGGASNNASVVTETSNYEISKTVTSKVSEVGKVQRLSVAVVVDGRYEPVLDEEGEPTDEMQYVPRSDEELEQYRILVRRAIGYDQARGDKVEIINMQFSRDLAAMMENEGPFDFLKHKLDDIIKMLIFGIVAILVIMLVVRPIVNKAFDVSTADLEAEAMQVQAEAAVAGGGGGAGVDQLMGQMADTSESIDLDIIQNRMDGTPARKINDLIDNNPEETLAVIRNWLSNKG